MGEAVACDESGVPSFERIRYRRHDTSVFLYAFDLIELNGDDLRRDPLEVRKATLATVLTEASHGIWYNDHVEDDGQTVFRHACKLGLEGIVSKRKDSPYRSGRSPDWLKMRTRVAECLQSWPEWLSKKCKLLFRASVIWLTHPLPVPPYVWNSQEADMALQPHRLEFKPHKFEFIFAMVLAMAVTILAITTWAAPSNPDNDSAASIPPIYRPDHRNLY